MPLRAQTPGTSIATKYPERKPVPDPIPRVCVRFDDGDLAQVQDVHRFLNRSIPVTLALNIERNLNQGIPGGLMDIQTINDLQRYAGSKKTKLELANHSNFNWGRHAPYSSASDLDDYTWAEAVAELNTDLYEEHGLKRPKVYVQPGDAHVNLWCRSKRRILQEIMQAEGIEYAIGLVKVLYLEEGIPNTFAVNNASNLQSPLGVEYQESGTRPGITTNPYEFSAQYTVDLGNKVFPVDDWSAEQSGAKRWMLGDDNNGNGQEGTRTTDFRHTLQQWIQRKIGMGLSFQLALHGEERSNNATIDNGLITPQPAGVPLTNHLQYRALAWYLSALEDLGYIKLVTLSEWCEYAHGYYPEGMDIVGNPDFKIFGVDFQEVAAGQMLVPRGFSSTLMGANTWTASAISPVQNLTEHSTIPLTVQEEQINAVFKGNEFMQDGQGEGGRPAIVLRPDATGNDIPLDYYADFIGIPPGVYELTQPFDQDGGSISLRKFGGLGITTVTNRLGKLGETDWADHSLRYAMIPQFMYYNGFRTLSFGQTQLWGNWSWRLVLPRHAPLATAYGIATLAGSTPVNFGTPVTVVQSVPGAVPGDRVLLNISDWTRFTPNEHRVTAEVTALDEVTVTFERMVAGTTTPPSNVNVTLFCYGQQQQWARPAGDAYGESFSPDYEQSSDIVWTFGYNYQKGGTSEFRVCAPTLRLIQHL